MLAGSFPAQGGRRPDPTRGTRRARSRAGSAVSRVADGSSYGVHRQVGADATLIREVILAARRVHAALGPGFVESTYENAVAVQLRAQAVPYDRQVPVPVRYREIVVGVHRVDLLVDRRLIVEMKAVKDLLRVHFAVLRSYLRATGCDSGLLLNFGRDSLDVRHVLPPAPNERPRAWAGARPFSRRTRSL